MWSPSMHAVLAVCMCFVSQCGSAADELTLAGALERARATHPQLAGLVFEARIQDAQARIAALRPAPEVEVLIEDVAGSGERHGFDAAQTTLSLSQLLELGGKRESRLQVAEAQRARLRTEQAARQLDVAAAVARSFVEMVARQERVVAARDAVALSTRVRAAVEERVRAAASPEAERWRASVATAETGLDLDDAVHALETARFQLAAAMGFSAPDFTRVSAELFALPPSPTFEALMSRLEAAPDFLRFTDEARLRDAELRLAQSQRRGDLHATLGVRRFESSDDTALVAGVSVPLFAGSRAAPAIDAAEAGREQVAPTRHAALLKARAQLFAHYQEMEHARHVVATLHDKMLPELGKALAQTEYAYRRGRYSYLEWSEAQRQQLQARARSIDAAAAFHTHRIEIERLTGESLVESGENE